MILVVWGTLMTIILLWIGISYLSRAQESVAKERMDNSVASKLGQSSTPHSVADSVFVGRIKSRVTHWLKACKDSNTGNEGE